MLMITAYAQERLNNAQAYIKSAQTPYQLRTAVDALNMICFQYNIDIRQVFPAVSSSAPIEPIKVVLIEEEKKAENQKMCCPYCDFVTEKSEYSIKAHVGRKHPGKEVRWTLG